jgi:predicted translin family RNA/ssDNA-binding protein
MKEIFAKLRKEIQQKDEQREELIVKSRPIIKSSKQAIYALHRNEIKAAEQFLKDAKKGLNALKPADIGIYNAALQEYAEAATYFYYVTKGILVDNEEIKVDAENYLLGICDLTGELARRAVFCVVNEEYPDVEKIREFVTSIHEEFTEFELRNGELRKKADSIKWNLKKIEEILYDIKIRGKI